MKVTFLFSRFIPKRYCEYAKKPLPRLVLASKDLFLLAKYLHFYERRKRIPYTSVVPIFRQRASKSDLSFSST